MKRDEERDLMAQTSLSRKAEDLLSETRRLREQVLSFKRSARAVMRPLGKLVSPVENEAMVTPRANALGTLENLVNQEIGSFLRQLTELEGDLRSDSLREGEASPEP
jgi:hypothetical protein